jgi:general secretion pathway protein D
MAGVADPDTPTAVTFTDEVAPQIVRWLELNTDKIILQAQDLPATRLNFTSNHNIPLAEAVFALQSLLAMNGVAIVPMSGNVFRAVPNQDTTTKAPAIATDDVMKLPGNEDVYSRFFHLDNITSDDAARLLTPFMSPRISALISFERSNSIFVTDSLLNLQRIEEILKRADVESEIAEDTLYIQLKNAKSSDVLTHLTRIQAGPLRKYIGTNTSFEADDRTNMIIAVTPKSDDDMVKKIITSLDADVDPTTRAELFKIKQAVSGTVVQELQQIVTGVQQQNSTRPTTATGGANPGGGAAPGAPGPGAAAGGGIVAGGGGAAARAAAAGAANADRDQQFSPYVTIISDDRSNSVVVYGTSSDIRQLGDLIDKIDVPLPQVRIEAVITEVTLSKGQVSGLSSFGLSYHFLPGNTTTGSSGDAGGSRDVVVTTGTNAPPSSSTPAFTFTGSLTNFGLDTVFNVASTNDKVKVLSAPNITNTHNSQATIAVTENYPLVTSTTTQIQNAATVGNNVTQTVTYQQIGITLTVTPLIGDNGIIQMNITQNDENIISFIPINGIEQPIIGQREATSFVSVKDGEVIVLGGLQQTNHNVEHDKVFFLGDLPLIGQLFQPVTYSDSTSELIIFIKPTIIHSTSAANIIANETVSTSLASKSVASYLSTGVVLPPSPHVSDNSDDPLVNNGNNTADTTPPPKQIRPNPGLNK